jgi:hypothetical protein
VAPATVSAGWLWEMRSATVARVRNRNPMEVADDLGHRFWRLLPYGQWEAIPSWLTWKCRVRHFQGSPTTQSSEPHTFDTKLTCEPLRDRSLARALRDKPAGIFNRFGTFALVMGTGTPPQTALGQGHWLTKPRRSVVLVVQENPVTLGSHLCENTRGTRVWRTE